MDPTKVSSQINSLNQSKVSFNKPNKDEGDFHKNPYYTYNSSMIGDNN